MGLGLLCAAQEALSLEVIAELAGWSYVLRRELLAQPRDDLHPPVAGKLLRISPRRPLEASGEPEDGDH